MNFQIFCFTFLHISLTIPRKVCNNNLATVLFRQKALDFRLLKNKFLNFCKNGQKFQFALYVERMIVTK
jgi:hypothetical protein